MTRNLYAEIGTIVGSTKDPKAQDAALVKMLIRRKLHEREEFPDGLLEAAGDLCSIDLSVWVRITVRLQELAVGYELT